MADKPSRALVIYGDGLLPVVGPQHRHLHELAVSGSCGFLALRALPPSGPNLCLSLSRTVSVSLFWLACLLSFSSCCRRSLVHLWSRFFFFFFCLQRHCHSWHDIVIRFRKAKHRISRSLWDVELCTKVFAALLLTEMGFCPSLDTQEVNDTLHMVTLSVDTTTVLILSWIQRCTCLSCICFSWHTSS